MNGAVQIRNLVFGVAGAAAGGVAGYFAFSWIMRQGFYPLVLPGALLGLGAGLWVKDRSVARATVCAVAALLLGLGIEWRFHPFVQDDGLVYFLGHLHQLQPITWVMIAAGAACGGWLALGKER